MRKSVMLFLLVVLLGITPTALANQDDEYEGPVPILTDFLQALRRDRLICLNWAYTKTGFMPTKETLSEIRGGEEFMGEIRKFHEPVTPPFSSLGGTGFNIDLNLTYENSKNDFLNAYGACRLFQGYAIGVRPVKKK